MATTRILTIHRNKGKSIAATLALRTDYPKNPDKVKDKSIEKTITDSTGYAQNPQKTFGGELIKTYACNPQTIDGEFLLSKKEYDYITGRDQGSKNILAYHIRQSFKPGEIEPQQALEIGYELAMRFTKGQHAFIVATHTDKAHIHECVKQVATLFFNFFIYFRCLTCALELFCYLAKLMAKTYHRAFPKRINKISYHKV